MKTNFPFNFMAACIKSLPALLFVAYFSSCTSGGGDIKLIPVKTGEKWQYIDKTGKIVINPQFSYATLFHDGLALVKTEGEKPLYGYIGEDGKFIINAMYVSASIFSEGLACVTPENGSPTYIDTKGQIKFTLKDADVAYIFTEGLALFSLLKEGEKVFGYIDKTGNIKITPQFSNCSVFSDGLAAVMNTEQKWGFIDVNGTLVIPYQFVSAGDFLDGEAIVSDGKNIGFIDKTGKYLVNPQFQDALAYSEGLAGIKLNDKWGFIDKEGKIQINPQFEDVLPFMGGLAPVKSNGKYGYIDKEGKIEINPQFDDASNFYGEVAFITANEKIGLIDKTGKYLLNPQFEDINGEIYMTKTIYAGLISSDRNYDLDRIVETDFFSVDQVVASLIPSISSGIINNITGNSTLKEVMEKYHVKNDQLPKNSYSPYFEINKQKTKYFNHSMSFHFQGTIIESVFDNATGKYTYTPVEATKLSVISSTAILKGKAIERMNEIYEAVKKNLTANGFTFMNDTWGLETYSSNNNTYGVNLLKGGDRITISYPFSQEEMVGYQPSYNRSGFPGENVEQFTDPYGD